MQNDAHLVSSYPAADGEGGGEGGGGGGTIIHGCTELFQGGAAGRPGWQ